LTRKWFESAQAIGLPLNPDFNGESQEGVGLFEFTIHGAGGCRRPGPSSARR
jgi:choline dehydrogenase